MAHGKSHDSHGNLGHIIPPSVSTTILVALLILTVVTVAVAKVDFGNLNIIVAMAIASVKAGLVIVFFMHGLHESKILWTYILIPFILVVIMIGGTFTDDPFRAKPVPVAVEGKK